MENIVQVLPDNVANQIAAGEVVQRPASVVKELVENAIDAGSKSIILIIKEAGKTLVQVVDTGRGMTEIDARLAFERHATSKIRKADDLFALHTFGFRGEALASIASIAEIELKTRMDGSELGTYILMRGSVVEKQEPVSTAVGTSIAVKNLFYNVPARRKFLKSDAVELRHIENELRRAALCHPEVAFAFWNNGNQLLELPTGTLKQRIATLFSSNKGVKKGLLNLETATHVVKIKGYVVSSEFASKEQDKQFLFVNGRYFQSSYFRSAIIRAYEQLIPQGTYPAYFVYLEVDPSRIDVNIHPTKTEIKFEDEQVIWQILNAAVRSTLGKYALTPSLDFEGAALVDIPVRRPDAVFAEPSIPVDTSYNPFEPNGSRESKSAASRPITSWRSTFQNLPTDESHPFHGTQMELTLPSRINFDTPPPTAPSIAPQAANESGILLFQLKGKYIVQPSNNGLRLIDQARAHRRILYEQFLKHIEGGSAAQQELFPQTLKLEPTDYLLIIGMIGDLQHLGLDVRDFGNHTIVIQGVPAYATEKDSKQLVTELLELLKADERSLKQNYQHVLAASLAKSSAITAGKPLGTAEMTHLLEQLAMCSSPDVCPEGKPVIANITIEEIDKRLLK